jgi:hypothetical protein
MSLSDDARSLYRDGKLLIDATRDLAATNDLLRWAREDLEEELLDLKLAVIDGNEFEMPDQIRAVLAMFAEVWRIVDPPADDEDE